MVIDKEQLISLLTEKSGLEREQVEKQLSELIDRIRAAAEEGKKFEVEGFGTFSMQEGNLQFEPSDTLETEINNKYAGMKPIELIGAFKQPEGDEIPDIDKETDEEERRQVWAYDETASVEEEEPEEATEPEAEPAEEQVHAGGEEQEEITEDTEAEGQEDTSDEEDPDKIFEAIFGSSREKAEAPAKPKEPSSQLEIQKAVPEKKDTVEEEDDDLIGRLLVAAVIVIALGVGGWLVYDTGLIGGNNSADNRQQEMTQQTGVPAQQTGDQENEAPQEDVAKTSETNKTSEPEQDKEVASNKESQPNTENQSQETYGLRGDLEQSVTNGYTIVVHSLTSASKAETQRDKLRQAGFRALISTVEVGGQTRYRVGIGQFKSVEAAQQAVSEIPESFQSSSNHFIKRIQ